MEERKATGDGRAMAARQVAAAQQAAATEELVRDLDAYIAANWEDVVADIDALVRIPSYESPDRRVANAPFGVGPRAALTCVLDIAERMGFETRDVDGYLGFAEFPGSGERAGHLGIIGHVDVVPAGPGWTVPPFAVTRRDGYLMGRGVLDDKGPVVAALYAMKFWKDRQDAGLEPPFPYAVRFLFGANEETGMADVTYYRQRYADPAFLFTPDADFPVCHGEKGVYDGTLTSACIPASERVIAKLSGGAASNAVPGTASAVVRANASDLPAAPNITVSEADDGLARIETVGKSAHASLPHGGVNAIALLVDYLLACDLCSAPERAFLETERRLLAGADGSGVGLAASDEHFGALTLVGGVVSLQGDRFVQTVDCRFPTSISADRITERLRQEADEIGGTFECQLVMEPFLVDPDHPAIQALLDAYGRITGQEAEPFTMGGGTYARRFSAAASFGPEMPWAEQPDWVGSIHGPDEAVNETQLQTALKIYAIALRNLQRLAL